MNCLEYQDIIYSYPDSELEGKQRSEIEAHLVSCSDCSLEAADWRTCISWLRNTFPDQTPPESLWESFRSPKRTETG